MKASQVQIGGRYLAKVSGQIVVVRVEGMRAGSDWKGRAYTCYDVTNMQTLRHLTFRSAARLRQPAPQGLATPLAALRHHVSGAIRRGEAVHVVCQPIPFREAECGGAFDGVIVSSDADSGL